MERYAISAFKRGKMTVGCYICGRTDKKLVQHHLDYKNNITITICTKCHRIIHSSDKLKEYKPNDLPPFRIIKLNEETHERLMAIGKKGETFDEIVNRLLEGDIQ